MVWFVDEAIKQNIKTSDVYAGGAPLSAGAMQKAIEWMSQAARYRVELPLVPHAGEDRFEALASRYAHGLIPPEKFSVIEYEHGGRYDTKADLTRALATKRIAVCVDLESEDGVDMAGVKGFVRRPNDDGGLLVWSLNYFEEKKDWEFAPGAAIIDRYQVREILTARKRSSGLRGFGESLHKRFFEEPKEEQVLTTRYMVMLPEIWESLGEDHRHKAIVETNLDAVWVALGFFSSFGCENVSLDETARSLYVRGVDATKPVPLDPFHGRRTEDFRGRQIWQQTSTFKTPD